MTLVDSTALSAYMGGATWTEIQESHITDVVLPGVQQELELYLNRPVEPMHVREARPIDDCGRVFLTVTPVWEVIGIDLNGTVETPTQYQPAALSDVPAIARKYDPAITKMSGTPFWAAQPGFITVTAYISSLLAGVPNQAVVEYIGGYLGYTDDALKLAILRVAAREVERLYDTSIGLRDGAGQPAGESDRRGKGWTPQELAMFDRLRRRVVST